MFSNFNRTPRMNKFTGQQRERVQKRSQLLSERSVLHTLWVCPFFPQPLNVINVGPQLTNFESPQSRNHDESSKTTHLIHDTSLEHTSTHIPEADLSGEVRRVLPVRSKRRRIYPRSDAGDEVSKRLNKSLWHTEMFTFTCSPSREIAEVVSSTVRAPAV